jgi:hypothetical protein
MRMLYALVVVASLTAGASSAKAQVTVEFQDGKVRLQAQSVSVSQILAEWARRGRTTIVNGERVPGPAVTLELQDVSEQQALDVVLRGVSGYLVAPRETAIAGASAFDRIYILPTSSRPTNASPLPPQQQQAVQPQIQDDFGDDNPPPAGARGVVNNPGARLPRDIVQPGAQPGVAGRLPALDDDGRNDPQNPPPAPNNPFAPNTVRPGAVTPGTPSPTPPGAITPAVPAPNTPGMITPAPAPNNRPPNNQ